MQRQCGGDIQHLVHAGFGRLRHSAAGIGGERFEIPARPFRIQHAQRQRGFAGAGHTRNSHNFAQRNIYINVFQIVDLRPTDKHFIYHCFSPDTSLSISIINSIIKLPEGIKRSAKRKTPRHEYRAAETGIMKRAWQSAMPDLSKKWPCHFFSRKNRLFCASVVR